MAARLRTGAILVLAALLLALPFALRPAAQAEDWRPGDPRLSVITPHNQAIRHEFARGFSAWHRERYGRPVQVDWVVVGGTTEISRYLVSEFVAAARAWWRSRGQPWPPGAAEALLAPEASARGASTAAAAALRAAFRGTDDASAFTSGLDLFFGGGEYDHRKAFEQGLTVPPWPDGPPARLLATAGGEELIPERAWGETWRGDTFFGTALSSFGICFNRDRLRDLGLAEPSRWEDLADPSYFRQIGAADPTKSGSAAKAFEMMIHERMAAEVAAAGFGAAEVEGLEAAIRARGASVPAAYEEALERGWRAGLELVQRIGANARYFTAASQRVPFEVAMGEVAAGITIDFYGRFQAQFTPEGAARLGFVTPAGGSSVSCDPVSLLRGAPHRETAVRFLEFVLSEAGQKLWCYRPGVSGGPQQHALRRLPIRRDFYPSAVAELQAAYEGHRPWLADDLGDPAVDPYVLAARFSYHARWTAEHFHVHRDLIRAMCLDSAAELQAAWESILRHGGPEANGAAMAELRRLPDRPEGLSWRSALRIVREHRRLDYLREWTEFFRASYRRARELADAAGAP